MKKKIRSRQYRKVLGTFPKLSGTQFDLIQQPCLVVQDDC